MTSRTCQPAAYYPFLAEAGRDPSRAMSRHDIAKHCCIYPFVTENGSHTIQGAPVLSAMEEKEEERGMMCEKARFRPRYAASVRPSVGEEREGGEGEKKACRMHDREGWIGMGSANGRWTDRWTRTTGTDCRRGTSESGGGFGDICREENDLFSL